MKSEILSSRKKLQTLIKHRVKKPVVQICEKISKAELQYKEKNK